MLGQHCLSDCLTKHSAKADNLIEAVESGILPQSDVHMPFRDMIQHKAYLSSWIAKHLHTDSPVLTFLNEIVV